MVHTYVRTYLLRRKAISHKQPGVLLGKAGLGKAGLRKAGLLVRWVVDEPHNGTGICAC